MDRPLQEQVKKALVLLLESPSLPEDLLGNFFNLSNLQLLALLD